MRSMMSGAIGTVPSIPNACYTFTMLHFAVAGSPLSTPSPGGSVEGLKRAHKLGITAMELEWVQRVPMNKGRMDEIRSVAEDLDMYLTVHAPYFVNLNAKEKAKLEASKKRIIHALEMAQLAGAKSVCVHPAFYLGMDPKVAYKNVDKAISEIMKIKKKVAPNVNLALETMGKGTQFGSLEELLKLGKKYKIYPAVDVAHMHARSNGKWNTKKEFNQVFDMYEKYLGKKSLKEMHIHYSGIMYTEKGERKHLPFKKSDAAWKEFVEVLKKRKIGGVVVCESPIMEKDTLLLKKTYEKC